jgi:hypothetical protein
MLGLGVLAFVVRLVPVLRGGGLHGVLAYDGGVYFAAAEAFVFGRLPYRDFLLLHPPGIVVVLSPFAWLARVTDDDSTGIALARLVFMGVGALNAVLVCRVARASLGVVAGVAGGVFYAVWPPAVFAERTTLLEPWVNLGLLTGLLLLGDPRTASRRRLALAGAALGLATAVKLWAVVPLAVLLCWLALRRGRAALRCAAGAAGAVAVVCLPFFLSAPASMVRHVVLDQLGRPDTGAPWQKRLAGMTTAQYLGRLEPHQLIWQGVLPAALALVAVAVAVRRSPRARPWCALLVAQGAVLLTSPAYFPHYGGYAAPALALVVGATAADVVSVLRRFAPSQVPVAVVTGVVAALCLLAVSVLRTDGRRAPGPQFQAMLSAARCVAADSPGTLQAADLFVRNLRNDCAVVPDPTGMAYDLDPGGRHTRGSVAARRAHVEWQHWMQRWFADSDAVVVRHDSAAGLSPETLGALARGSTATSYRRYQVYVAR